MPNHYAAPCYRCGKLCLPGEGVFEKVGKPQRKKWPGHRLPNWLAQHHECAAEFRGTSVHYQFNPMEDPMKLITKEIEKKLLENGAAAAEGIDTSDRKPVLKLFCPWGAATWLISEMDPEEPDFLFGLCDLGFGFPELGGVSLKELESVRGPAGLKLERDTYFTAEKTIGEYAKEAWAAGRILA